MWAAGAIPHQPRLALAAPRLATVVAALGSATALAVALWVAAPGLAAGVVGLAGARTLAGGEQVAAALETYQLENGTFPVAADPAELRGDLAPLLPDWVRLA